MLHFLLLLIVTTIPFSSQAQPGANPLKKIFCTTIPKTGTHLLEKCLSMMDIEDVTFNYTKNCTAQVMKDINEPFFPHVYEEFKNPLSKVILRHMHHTLEAEEIIKHYTYANFITIRDPRAQLVSLAFAVKKNRIGAEHKTVEHLLIDFIKGRRENFLQTNRHSLFPPVVDEKKVLYMVDLVWFLGAYKFYQLFTPWMKAENFYTVRFENLVGPRGGGSLELQHHEIKNIAQHAGINLPQEKILHIADSLFGGTATFREGKIDGWKQHFTASVKEAFKADDNLMQLLIDLGYEKDKSW